MNGEEVLKMPAGLEMDALIAQKVMGLPEIKLEEASCPYCGCGMRFCGERSRCTECQEWRYAPYKDYSCEIADAWDVMEKIKSGVLEVAIAFDSLDGLWHFSIWDEKVGYHAVTASADTAPLAICRGGALWAAMGEQPPC